MPPFVFFHVFSPSLWSDVSVVLKEDIAEERQKVFFNKSLSQSEVILTIQLSSNLSTSENVTVYLQVHVCFSMNLSMCILGN